ncbi:D-alanyl-D-alanine carboxypeptidase [Bacillus sp. AFS094611]|uniref:serine-type D-Ala-D-Ala carboxypeptidase n=3 Tax=Bacillaceae TaxID=186817 RepID=A0A2A7D1C0_BACAN|nr:D-alanyl-D-alanine carboxypeptidase [Bacillus thuringiensis serovar coreanensis]OTX55726.1 D-alanyl-D-alanine carboxypeptidase [Bacillus thuringiensis serovar sooncheon]OTX59463.1 D-alanyl-D-alanine carboxypeptidase [Bacillus thuringiensis serovar guiyangiensis]OTX74066.1 D-alanyl-D-alanine carboxypeptidase [Bacillus thuringiensis serovar roskildiensis]PDZ13474.1 D-alanyl-D-alanine carboxypeptidase [Bacillus anthracis]PDZ50166.1 D-alanyl-D-alanine carboxypeptidase [Bacillus sp. AFS094611]
MKGMFCKRFIALVTMLALACSMLLPYSNASAETGSALNIEAGAAILVEANSGKILYQKNADELLSIASMTKMMSEYLVNEAVAKGKLKWDQRVKVSEYAYKISQDRSLSNVPLRNGESYTVKELYEAMAIYSANGATIALAEAIAGKEVDFVKLMNDKSKELGLKNYKFVNSTGLTNKDLKGQHPEGTTPDEENKMAARDVAILAQRIIQDFPKTLDTAKISKKTFREGTTDRIDMINWNWMLPGLSKAYDGVDGLKTGSTPEAGDCFTGTIEKDGMRFISVVIKTKSRDARFDETKKLYDYGFANFEMKQLYKKGSSVKGQETVRVENATDKDVAVQTKKAVSLPVPKGSKDVYKTELKEASKGQEAPIKKGAALGKMVITPKDTNDPGFLSSKSLQIDLVTTSAVEEANWFTRSMRGIGSFFSGIWNSAVDTVKGWF